MKVNLDILNKIAKVKSSPGVIIDEDKIVNRKGSEVAIIYKPEEQIFEKSFCVFNLTEFISFLSYFDEPELIFKDKDIIIKDSKSVVKYRSGVKLDDDVIKNGMALSLVNTTRDVIDNNGLFTKFCLTNDKIKEYQAMGSRIKKESNVPRITFKKNKSDSEMSVDITCSLNDNSFHTVLEYQFSNVDEFEHSFNIDTFQTTINGDWECYLLGEGNVDKQDGDIVPNIFLYMVAHDDHIQMIITQIQN